MPVHVGLNYSRSGGLACDSSTSTWGEGSPSSSPRRPTTLSTESYGRLTVVPSPLLVMVKVPEAVEV